MRKFRTVYMRGGTSKGCFFRKADLPENREEWDHIFLQVMGSPDPKQIDGMGGCVSSNNKIVVVSKSDKTGVDVDYLVGQVAVGKNRVDYGANCGNMTAGVPLYAVQEGLVSVKEPKTTVHMHNLNTGSRIDADVIIDPETHEPALDGDCRIAGVDGTDAPIDLSFMDPEGSKTGKLFPTGNAADEIEIEGSGRIKVSVIDVMNPLVLVRAEDIGLKGTELPEEMNADSRAMSLLEEIRGTVCCMMGMASDLHDAKENSPGVPKIGVFALPKDYRDIAGNMVKAEEADLCVRVLSVLKCHKACPLTAAGAIASLAKIDGTVVSQAGIRCEDKVRIAHPSGVMDVMVETEHTSVRAVHAVRTARRIMDGTVYIKE